MCSISWLNTIIFLFYVEDLDTFCLLRITTVKMIKNSLFVVCALGNYPGTRRVLIISSGCTCFYLGKWNFHFARWLYSQWLFQQGQVWSIWLHRLMFEKFQEVQNSPRRSQKQIPPVVLSEQICRLDGSTAWSIYQHWKRFLIFSFILV